VFLSNWHHSLWFIASAFAVVGICGDAAPAAEPSGCSALAARPISLPQGAVSTHDTGAVPLRAGETLRLRMIAPPGQTGAGSIALNDGGEPDAAIISGAAPQETSFSVPYDGLFGLEFHSEGPAPVTFEVICETGAGIAASASLQAFTQRRAARILADDTAQASLRRRANKPNSLDQAVKSSAILDENGQPQQVSVITSLQNLAAADGQKFADNKLDFWVEGRVSLFEHQFDENGLRYDADGDAGTLNLGTDYLLQPGLMVGALVQLDRYAEAIGKFDAATESRGLLFGPYASIRLAPDLVFDARAAWGSSENDAALPDGTRLSFETDRQLLRGQLTGNRNLFGIQVAPSLALSVVEDRVDGSENLADQSIPDANAALGRLGVGSTFSYRFALEDGGYIQPSAGLSTGWTLDGLDALAFDGTQLSNETGAKAEAGLMLGTAEGVSIEASGAVEGIGQEDYSAWSGRLSLTAPLN
jgi:hypothetical protein